MIYKSVYKYRILSDNHMLLLPFLHAANDINKET